MSKPKVTFVIAGESQGSAALQSLQDRLNETAYGSADGSKKGHKVVVLANGSGVFPVRG